MLYYRNIRVDYYVYMYKHTYVYTCIIYYAIAQFTTRPILKLVNHFEASRPALKQANPIRNRKTLVASLEAR